MFDPIHHKLANKGLQIVGGAGVVVGIGNQKVVGCGRYGHQMLAPRGLGRLALGQGGGAEGQRTRAGDRGRGGAIHGTDPWDSQRADVQFGDFERMAKQLDEGLLS